MFQPHAYTTPIRKKPLPVSQAKVFTLIQGISTATYLTFPRLPNQPIGPEPFQYLFLRSSLMVLPKGIEPLRLAAREPKPRTSASSATVTY